MRLIYLYVLALLVFTGSVQAREEFWYAGLGGGVTFLNDKDNAFTDIDEKSNMAKAYVGYRASTYLAFELEADYLGKYDYSRGALEDKAEFSTASLAIVVMYPLIWEDFELYTPIAVSAISADYGVKSETIGGYKLGFGVAYTPTKHFSMRLGGDVTIFDLEYADITYKQQLSTVNLSLQINF